MRRFTPWPLMAAVLGLFASSLYAVQPEGLKGTFGNQLDIVAKGQTIVAGYSGAWWFGSANNGEGILLQMLEGGGAAAYWFTMDPNGDQAWLVGSGTVSGDTITFDDMRRPNGTSFGETFDPAAIDTASWGRMSIVFDDCDKGELTYEGPETWGAGTRSLTRLTNIQGVDCSASTKAINPGISGGWWESPGHVGEGFIIQTPSVFSGEQAVVYWFTVDTDGSQAWILGQARVNGNRLEVSVEDSEVPAGAIFGAGFDHSEVNRPAWGSFSIEFDKDNGEPIGHLSYDATEGMARFGSGSQTLNTFVPAAGVPADPVTEPGSAGRGTPFEFFLGSIEAVDPTEPAGAPVVLDPEGRGFGANSASGFAFALIDGDFDRNDLNGADVGQLLYRRDNGTLWRVKTVPEEGSIPAPVRVSSISDVTERCDFELSNDGKNLLNSRFLIGRSNTPGCPESGADLEWKAVSIGEDSETAPAPFPAWPRAAVLGNDASHAGWLAIRDGEAAFVDANREVTPLGAAVEMSLFRIGTLPAHGKSFLAIDSALYRFDLASRSLDDLGYGLESGSGFPASAEAGDDHLFVIAKIGTDASTVEYELLRFGAQGDGTTLHRFTAPAGREPDIVTIANGRVAYVRPMETGSRLQSLPIDGDETGLLTLDEGEIQFDTVSLQPQEGRWVFYQKGNNSEGFEAAVVGIDDPGSINVWSGGLWLGAVLGAVPTQLLVTEASTEPLSAEELWGVDMNDPTREPINLGVMPEGVAFVQFTVGLGRTALGRGWRSDEAGGGTSGGMDIVFIDVTQPNSLRKITDTPDQAEEPIPLF